MKYLLWLRLLGVLGMIGCDKPQPKLKPEDRVASITRAASALIITSILPQSSQAAPPPNSIAALKAFAKKNRLYYHIWCIEWSEEERYQADICRANCRLLYPDEGGKGMWLAEGDTQEEAAAKALAEAEAGESQITYFKRDTDASQKKKHRQCKPLIIGGPQ
jgi:hypothetical protein